MPVIGTPFGFEPLLLCAQGLGSGRGLPGTPPLFRGQRARLTSCNRSCHVHVDVEFAHVFGKCIPAGELAFELLDSGSSSLSVGLLLRSGCQSSAFSGANKLSCEVQKNQQGHS